MTFIQSLQAQLKQKGEIPFIEFMQKALYAPQEGYYSSGLAKIGVEGDFITAPELSPLFGQTLALHCQPILSLLKKPSLFEFGAGTGKLCVDLLSHLESLNALPEQYLILELSADLRHRQQELIEKRVPHLVSRVQWLNQWPEQPFEGIILANEVLDAMPVHRFLLTEEGLLESHIRLDEKDQLTEFFKLTQNEALLTYVHQHLDELPRPYLSEANLFLNSWMAELYQILSKGLVLLIDYGFPRHEYYHPDRHQGTLMCHYRHQSHPNPLLHPGEQDISAHVDFTQVAEAGHQAGFHIAGYTNQASFLLENGLLHLANTSDQKERFQFNQAIKQLTLPSEMGELFKVIALTKQLEVDLKGFQLHDKRASL